MAGFWLGEVPLAGVFEVVVVSAPEVPDPYYGDEDGFVAVLAMVRAAVPGLLDWVRAQP